MTGEVGNCVFAHALMQERRDEKVSEGVQVVAFREAQLREQRLQVQARRIRVDERPVILRKNMLRELN